MQVSISGLDKAAVLAALYNAARPQGMGFLSYMPEPMTTEQAQAILDSGQAYFDYLHGRVMKVDLKGDEFESQWYDRDNGPGAAACVIDSLRRTGHTNNDTVETIHKVGKEQAAEIVRDRINTLTTVEVDK